MRSSRLLTLTAVFLAACLPPVDPSDPPGETSSAIEGGVWDGDTPRANATVHLQGDNTECSGTLVSPTQVLTAAHCVSPKIPPHMPSEPLSATVVNGEILATGGDRRMYAVKATTDTIDNVPWAYVSSAEPDVVAATAFDDDIYIARGGRLWRGASVLGPWQDYGSAPGMIGLAFTTTTIYAIDGGFLYRRDRLATGSMFTRYAAAVYATALTADRQGRVYAGFSDGQIKVLSGTSWSPVGSLVGVNELSSDGDLLFAAAGGLLYVRRAEEWALDGWREAGVANSPAGIAATSTRLYRYRTDGQVYVRPTWLKWEPRETIPENFIGLAAWGPDLFALGGDGDLRVRAASTPSAPWLLVRAHDVPLVQWFDMAALSGTLYASNYDGIFQRPATRSGVGWTPLFQDALSRGMNIFTAAGTSLYGVNGERLYRRPIDGSSGWVNIGPAEHTRLLVPSGDRFYLIDSGLPVLEWSPIAAIDWHAVPRFDFQNSTISSPTRDRVTVSFGRDIRDFHDEITACAFRAPGETDMALLELERPVSASIATPAPIVYDTPSPGPSFWDSQVFTAAGWGLMLPEEETNKLVQRQGSSWVNLGVEVPYSTVSLSRTGSAWFAVTRLGDVFRRVGNGPFEPVTYGGTTVWVSGVKAAAGIGANFYAVHDYDIQIFDVSTGQFGSRFTVSSIYPGEKLMAATYLAGFVYVLTTEGRVLRVGALGGAWEDTRTHISAQAIASDSSRLYALSQSGFLYSRTPSETTWTIQADVKPATAIAAWTGVVYGSYPAMPAVRQTGTLDGWDWPYYGDEGRVRVTGSVVTHPGDSGGPLYWDNSSGVRHVIGATQGTEYHGGRWVTTFYHGGFNGSGPDQDISAWLRKSVVTARPAPPVCD